MKNQTPISDTASVSLNQTPIDYTHEYVPETKVWISSLLKQTTYDSLKHELTVTFNNGKKYKYLQFLPNTYKEFCQAESQGKFFLTEIRSKYTDVNKVIKIEDNE